MVSQPGRICSSHGARRGGPPPPGRLICSVGQVGFKIKVLACAAAVAFPDSGRVPGPTSRAYCLSVRRQWPRRPRPCVPTRRGRAAAVTVGPQVQVCAALAASSSLRGPGPGPAGSDGLLHTLGACHLRQLDIDAANWTWSYRANDLDRDFAVTQARSPVPHGAGPPRVTVTFRFGPEKYIPESCSSRRIWQSTNGFY